MKYGRNKTTFINKIIIVLAFLLLSINIYYLGVHIMSKYNYKLEAMEPGLQFTSFKKYLSGVERIGYLTNRDMSPQGNDGTFLQAQYFLAPTILELNNDQYQYNIIDSLDTFYLVYTMQQLKATRLTNNEFGQALIIKNP